MLIRLILIVAGLFIALNGHNEYKLLENSSQEPMPIELLDLESGAALPSTHVRVGYHWKLWDELIYSYRQEQHKADDDPSIKVDYVYYPLISNDHPHSKAYDELALRYESFADVPNEEVPLLKNFKVLVRTNEFKNVGQLPKTGHWTDADQLTGLVVNEVRRLDKEEKALLTQSYPNLKLDKILILEEGRVPKSLADCFMWIVSGSGLFVLGIYLIIRSTTGRKENAGQAPPLIKSAEVMA